MKLVEPPEGPKAEFSSVPKRSAKQLCYMQDDAVPEEDLPDPRLAAQAAVATSGKRQNSNMRPLTMLCYYSVGKEIEKLKHELHTTRETAKHLQHTLEDGH